MFHSAFSKRRFPYFFKLFFLGIFSCLMGCAHDPISNTLPHTPSDFEKSHAQLEKDFPAMIPLANPSLTSAFSPKMCQSSDDYFALLGPPDNIKKNYFLLGLMSTPLLGGVDAASLSVSFIMFASIPRLPEQRIWRKGNYVIIAHTMNSVMCRYHTSVALIEWQEIP